MTKATLLKCARLLALALILGFGLGAGCKRDPKVTEPGSRSPSLRLYVLSSVAGALEPCGCQKHMLGGVDHAAAFISKDRGDAQHTLVVGAGPMLFMDPVLEEGRKTQDLWKADALAESFGDLGLVGWAPGANDFAAGVSELRRFASKAKSELFAANLEKVGIDAKVVSRGPYRVGIVGVSEPRHPAGAPEGIDVGELEGSLAKGLSELEKQNAQIRVALVATDRGKALRLAETISGFDVMIVGKAYDRGEGNDAPVPPARIGETLVVQAPNHLQAVVVVDLFVRDGFAFKDGTGVEQAERRLSLDGRIQELERRLAAWADDEVAKADLEARRRDLERLKAERAKMVDVEPPKEGSYFLYRVVQVREELGTANDVSKRLSTYYRRVNEHNREAFKDRKPEPVQAGSSGYLGVSDCENCHEEETKFWRTTKHASAYETLTSQHKEFNLDCVSCHVTGYEKPGGSTVTHVDGLKDVQCESCHGPGSRHEDDPENADLIVKSPPKTLCQGCHHPPHVNEDWSAERAWPNIIGPGHGK